jgi:hypothetical protein
VDPLAVQTLSGAEVGIVYSPVSANKTFFFSDLRAFCDSGGTACIKHLQNCGAHFSVATAAVETVRAHGGRLGGLRFLMRYAHFFDERFSGARVRFKSPCGLHAYW